MYAIVLDKENYLKDISDTVRKPGSILVNSIPEEEDPEKMQCYQYIKEKYVFDAEKWQKSKQNAQKRRALPGLRRKSTH